MRQLASVILGPIARLTPYAKVVWHSPGQRRHLTQWMASMRFGWLLDNSRPWITFDAAEFLERRFCGTAAPGCDSAGKHLRVFEFGSGGSTLFWLNLGAQVVSVEHDPAWYELVRTKLPHGAEVDYRLLAPEPRNDNREGDPGNPADFASSHVSFRRHSFERYARAINEFPDASFDAILIDGRARPACLKQSLSKVKPQGIIVLDNADWCYYTDWCGGCPAGFTRRDFQGLGPCSPDRWTTAVFTPVRA